MNNCYYSPVIYIIHYFCWVKNFGLLTMQNKLLYRLKTCIRQVEEPSVGRSIDIHYLEVPSLSNSHKCYHLTMIYLLTSILSVLLSNTSSNVNECCSVNGVRSTRDLEKKTKSEYLAFFLTSLLLYTISLRLLNYNRHPKF